MLESPEDLLTLFANIGDLAVFPFGSLYVSPGHEVQVVPDYHGIQDQSKFQLCYLCATSEAVRLGLLTEDFKQANPMLEGGITFALNGLYCELLTVSVDPTGITYLWCTYV